MTVALLSHRQTRFSVSEAPEAPARAQGPSNNALVAKPAMPKFSAAKGFARAAVRAFTACGKFIKDLASKAIRLISGRSDATAPRASANVFAAQRSRTSANATQAPVSQPASGAATASAPAAGKPPSNGAARRPAMTSSGAQTSSVVPVVPVRRTGGTSVGVQTAPAVPARSTSTTSTASVGMQTVSVVSKPAATMVTIGTQTDPVPSKRAVRSSSKGSQTSQGSDSGVESAPSSPTAPIVKTRDPVAVSRVAPNVVTGVPAAVRGVPPAPPPPPTVAMLRPDARDPLAELRAARKVKADANVAAEEKAMPGANKQAPGKQFDVKKALAGVNADVVNSPLFQARRAALDAMEAAQAKA